MKINRDNYELFFINYFDGILKPSEVDELMLFLKNNPDMEDEFLNFGNINLPGKEEVSFDNKNKLKKSVSDKSTINHKNIDEFLVAYIENDLTYNDVDRLELFLKENPNYKNDLEIYQKTIITPDLKVVFNDKKLLKKKVLAKEYKIKYFYYTVAAAAAVILLFFNIFFSDISPINKKGMRLASKDTFLEAGMTHGLFSGSEHKTDTDNTEKNIKRNKNKLEVEDNINKSQSFEKISQKNAGSLLAVNNAPSEISGKREEYSSIFNYIQASEYKVEEKDYSDIIPDKPRESFIKYAANKIFSGKQKEETPTINSNKVDIWKIVDISTYGINSLANNKLIDISRKEENNKIKTDFAFGGNVIYSHTSSVK